MTSPAPYVASAALVSGASAYVIDRVLARYLPDLLLPAWLLAEVEATRVAIRRAALEYEARPIADNGISEAAIAAAEASSPHELCTADAAVFLGLSERRTRQLGPLLGRRVGRSWVFDRGAVLDYRDAVARRSA